MSGLPDRQLRKQRANWRCLPARGLPDRRLRNAANRCARPALCGLPDRQLRNAGRWFQCLFFRGLPDRQLRNGQTLRQMQCVCGLPDRQLRNVQARWSRPASCGLPDRQLRKLLAASFITSRLSPPNKTILSPRNSSTEYVTGSNFLPFARPLIQIACVCRQWIPLARHICEQLIMRGLSQASGMHSPGCNRS